MLFCQLLDLYFQKVLHIPTLNVNASPKTGIHNYMISLLLPHALILFDTRDKHVRHTESKTGIDLPSLPEFPRATSILNLISPLFTMNAYQMWWVVMEVTNDP